MTELFLYVTSSPSTLSIEALTPCLLRASLIAQLVKNLPAMQATVKNPPAMWKTWVQFNLSVGKIPWKREWLPTPVFWPGNSMDYIIHGVRKSQNWLNDFHFTSPACWWGGSRPLDKCLPPSSTTVVSTSNKANFFPPTWPIYWLLSDEQPDPPCIHFGNRQHK